MKSEDGNSDTLDDQHTKPHSRNKKKRKRTPRHDEQDSKPPARRTTGKKNGGATVTFDASSLSHLFVCPLCEGFFRDPYTTNSCRHTFCRSCLELYVNSEENLSAVLSATEVKGGTIPTNTTTKCPICKTYWGGRREIMKIAQPDHAWRDMQDKILFPDAFAAEGMREDDFYSRHRGIVSKKEFMRAESRDRVQQQSLDFVQDDEDDDEDGEDQDDEDYVEDDSDDDAKKGRKSRFSSRTVNISGCDITAMLNSVDPGSYSLRHPRIRTDGRTRIGQLKKYIQQKLQQENSSIDSQGPNDLESWQQVTISCQGTLLGDEFTIAFVTRTVWQDEANAPPGTSRSSSSFPLIRLNYKIVKEPPPLLSIKVVKQDTM